MNNLKDPPVNSSTTIYIHKNLFLFTERVGGQNICESVEACERLIA